MSRRLIVKIEPAMILIIISLCASLSILPSHLQQVNGWKNGQIDVPFKVQHTHKDAVTSENVPFNGEREDTACIKKPEMRVHFFPRLIVEVQAAVTAARAWYSYNIMSTDRRCNGRPVIWDYLHSHIDEIFFFLKKFSFYKWEKVGQASGRWLK